MVSKSIKIRQTKNIFDEINQDIDFWKFLPHIEYVSERTLHLDQFAAATHGRNAERAPYIAAINLTRGLNINPATAAYTSDVGRPPRPIK